MGLRALQLIVAGTNPGPSHLQCTERLAVPWQGIVVIVGDLHLNPPDGCAHGGTQAGELLVAVVIPMGAGGITRAQGAHLGHAPCMAGIDTVGIKFFHYRQRAGGATHNHLLQGFNPFSRTAQMIKKVKPHGGHAGRQRHALFIDECRQSRAIPHLVAGHDHLAARDGAGIGVAPGVDVEHGHDGHDHIATGHTQRVGHKGGVGMQHRRSVTVQNTLGVACGTRGIAERAGCTLIQLRPFELCRLTLQQGFVAVDVGQ